jgi:hypothetical protein
LTKYHVGAPGAPHEPNAETVNVSPLEAPVSPFRYGAELMRAMVPRADPELRAALEQQIAALEYMGEQIDAIHDQPLMLLAITRASLSAVDRDWLRRTLDVIDAVIADWPR